MNRRAFVLGSLSALAGCSAFPRDRQYPAKYYKPQLLFEWTWKPVAGELVIEVVAGNALTTENTAEIVVDSYGLDEAIVWADHNGDGQGDFPVEPGDSLTVPVAERATVRVVWVGDGPTVALDAYRFSDRTVTTEGADR